MNRSKKIKNISKKSEHKECWTEGWTDRRTSYILYKHMSLVFCNENIQYERLYSVLLTTA